MVKKFISTLLVIFILLVPITNSFSLEIETDPEWKPKVALVLSGGAALGLAHIGVLKVLEEIGIPVDLVIGNSMGALIGGLYAAGYSPGDIYNLSESINWNSVFLDLNRSTAETVFGNDQDILKVNLDNTGIFQDEGIIDDQRICSLLSRLTYKVSMIRDFDKLNIPFRTVAVDLRSGTEQEIRGGVLAEAMRASMGLPIVFDPIEAYGGYLIDGGVLNNLPVNMALKEGADIIISVNVEYLPELEQGGIKNTLDVADQTMRIVFNVNSHLAALSESDISIIPDLTGLSRFDFDQFKELTARGEAAAWSQYEELRALSVEIARYRPLEPKDPDRVGSYFKRPEIPFRYVFFDDRGHDREADSRLFENGPAEDLSLDDIETLIYYFNRNEDFRSLIYFLEPDTSMKEHNLKIVGTLSEQGDHELSLGLHFEARTGSESEITGDGYLNLLFRDLLIQDSKMNMGVSLYFANGADFDIVYSIPFYQNMNLVSFLEGKFYSSGIDAVSSNSKLENYQNLALGGDLEFDYHHLIKINFGYELAVDWYNSLGTLSDIQDNVDEQEHIFEFYQLLNFGTQWDFKTKGLFSRLGIEVSSDISFYIPFDFGGDPIRRAEIDGLLYFTPETDQLLYGDISLGYYRGDVQNQWTLYYPGGSGGIPGNVDEENEGHEKIFLGLGYRFPIDFLSEFIGMDTYLDSILRIGNTWNDINSVNELLPFKAGLGSGLIFQTPVGKLSAGMGISLDGSFSVNLRFNAAP